MDLRMWKTSSFSFKIKQPSSPLFYCVSIVFFLFLFCGLSIIISTATSLAIRCPFSGKAYFYFLDFEKKRNIENVEFLLITRRILIGLGSSPPHCTSKCGKCMPCKPVHVPVPPGNSVTAEYYPEAWRCKCGNKLYMP